MDWLGRGLEMMFQVTEKQFRIYEWNNLKSVYIYIILNYNYYNPVRCDREMKTCCHLAGQPSPLRIAINLASDWPLGHSEYLLGRDFCLDTFEMWYCTVFIYLILYCLDTFDFVLSGYNWYRTVWINLILYCLGETLWRNTERKCSRVRGSEGPDGSHLCSLGVGGSAWGAGRCCLIHCQCGLWACDHGTTSATSSDSTSLLSSASPGSSQ